MPIKAMSDYLTDRVSNYEELEPYFLLLENTPFVVFGFDADIYRNNVPLLPKGKDGMNVTSYYSQVAGQIKCDFICK